MWTVRQLSYGEHRSGGQLAHFVPQAREQTPEGGTDADPAQRMAQFVHPTIEIQLHH